MDGLRLALIIAGIVVVAAVYLWSARRSRINRDAGEFQSFDAWSDQSLDPLSDPEAKTQPNPRRDRGGAAVDTLTAAADGGEQETAGADAAPRRSPSRGLGDPRVLAGLQDIADTLDTRGGGETARSEPRIGALDAVAPPAAKGSEAGPAKPAAAGREPPGVRKPPPERKTAPAPAPARKERPPHATGGDTPAEMVVVLNVMAPEGERFEGPAVKAALEHAGLRAGDMQLYHFRAEAQPSGSPPIFSALNAVKPGTLDPDAFEGMHTPGIALVLRLPGVERPSEAFELMHGVATRIAGELGGRLCDESRSTLTKQSLNHLRETIADSVRRRRLGA